MDVICFFNDTATTEIYTLHIVGSVRCVQETGINAEYMGTISDFKLDEEFHKCAKCTYWKPERSHHCSVCNKCIYKMDHHCPWTLNCIGASNHRSFFLFIFYTGVCDAYFCIMEIDFLCRIYDGQRYLISLPMWINFLTMLVFAIPLCFAFAGLLLKQIYFVVTNTTTIDLLKLDGPAIRWPCQKAQLSSDIINEYDLGILGNVAQFFNNSKWLFWLPLKNYPEKDGLFQKQILVYKEIDQSYEMKERKLQEHSVNQQEISMVNEKQFLKQFENEWKQELQNYIYKTIKLGQQQFACDQFAARNIELQKIVEQLKTEVKKEEQILAQQPQQQNQPDQKK
eukprot:TRINITY_DN11775_c0_g1_i2.p1 TRINITY_DN11775_c0_g1~~TRINITY_DN11775_c0_g1_i2.p1  ORF type:complete len:339 (+),score=56.06 TRINITY_DN11775_c0_g1_i2:53-1069(+)